MTFQWTPEVKELRNDSYNDNSKSIIDERQPCIPTFFNRVPDKF